MSTEILPRTLVAHVPDAFLGYGADKDVDTALDDARATARDEYGHAGAVVSIADVDALDARVALSGPVSLKQAIRHAQLALGSGVEPGQIHAVAVGAETAWKRRRVTLAVTDTDLEVGTQEGELSHLTSEIEAMVLERLASAGTTLEDNEILEVVDVRRMRQRHKPVVTSHKGASASRFALWTQGDHVLVSDHHTNAGEARRAGVELLKAGPVLGREEVVLEVVKITTRPEDVPLMTLERSRIAQRGSLKVTLAVEKDPAKTRQIGWLFYGVAGGSTSDESADLDSTEG